MTQEAGPSSDGSFAATSASQARPTRIISSAKRRRAAAVRLAKKLSPPERDQRLLEYLREHLDRPGLKFQGTPRRLLGGTEAAILAFRLENAPTPFDGPLVLRRFRPGQDPDRSPVEAGIHDAAFAAGFATPRCVLHEEDSGVLGAAFLVLDQVEGETLLGGLAIDALGAKLRPRNLWLALRESPELWDRVPSYLADAALGVATIDGASVESSIRARGGPPRFLSLDARLARIERRIRKFGLDEPLAPALTWLAANRPAPPERLCLVHGDIGPTNLLVRDGEVTSLLDWSKAMLAEPEAELGFLRVALRTAAISGLGRWNRLLRWPLATVADRVTERYTAVRALDPARVRWYETMRALSLVASIAKRKKPSQRRPHVLDPCGTSDAIVRELQRVVGARMSLS